MCACVGRPEDGMRYVFKGLSTLHIGAGPLAKPRACPFQLVWPVSVLWGNCLALPPACWDPRCAAAHRAVYFPREWHSGPHTSITRDECSLALTSRPSLTSLGLLNTEAAVCALPGPAVYKLVYLQSTPCHLGTLLSVLERAERRYKEVK